MIALYPNRHFHCLKSFWLVTVLFCFASVPSLFAQHILMDFGQATTTNPDSNGNYWNNYASNTYLNLVTTQNAATSYYFANNVGGGFNTNFITGSPNLSAIGVFNVPTAYSDAINTTTNASYYFYNVNANLTYDFSLYGARDATTTRTTLYNVEGSNTGSGSVTTSGLGIGGTGINYNNSSLVNITGITSTTNYGGSLGNAVKITMTATSGGFAYLNAMSANGYIGYLSGGTTTLNGAPAAGYVANGTYAGTANSRSVDSVIGGGSTVNVNSGDGIYYNSTLVVTNGGGTVNVGTNFQAYALAGAGNLAVGGTNKLSLNHSGTYSGTMTLNGAGLVLGASNAIGTGNLILNGGNVDVGNASGFGTGAISVSSGTTTINNTGSLNNLTGNNAINLNGGWAGMQINGYGKTLNFGTGNVTVTGNNNLNAWNGGLEFDGVVSGTGLMNWYGSGTLALGGANTFSGTVTASGNSGTLVLANVNALQNATLNKGASHTVSFGVAGSNTYNLASLTGAGDINLGGNSLNITNGGTYSGKLSGTGGIAVAGTTTLSGANDFTGGTEVKSGTLNVNSTSALGTGLLTLHSGAQFGNNSGTAVVNANNNAILINGTNTFTGGTLNIGSGAVTVGGTSRINTAAGNLTLGGTISGSAGFAKDGGGTLTLAGSNSMTSFTIVDYGTLNLANENALAHAQLWLYDTTANKKVTFGLAGNNNYNIGDIGGTDGTGVLDLGANTVTVGVSGRSGSFNGKIEGSGGNFVKAGSGTYSLAGTNAYTGTTVVSGGTLAVSGDITSSSGTTVGNGSTLAVNGLAGSTVVNSGGSLKGSGSVGSLLLNSGSLLKPGNSPGNLTASSSIWSAGATYEWQIDGLTGTAGTTWDLFTVTGLLDMSGLSSSAKFNLAITADGGFAGWSDGSQYDYTFAKAAGISGLSGLTAGTDISSLFNITTSGFTYLPNSSANLAGDFKIVVGDTSGGYTSLNLMAVPEPPSSWLFGIGLLTLVGLQKFRRSRVRQS